MGKKKKKQKPKKEKIVYIDDNSTVADMRPVNKKGVPVDPPPRATTREKARTFFAAFKMMLIPCACVLVAFTLLYFILRLIAGQ